MALSKHKTKRYILPVIILVIFVLLGLNLYLGKRLERYLKSELIERTTKATDGFYSLSFNKLSINLWNGELRIEGIEIKPDSVLFNQWMDIDSLPENYVHATVDVIDFKGINLIWKTNYKRLHFQSFEIDHPNIKVYNSTFSYRLEKATKNLSGQTLYELIEPYIDVLSVKSLNLNRASVSYSISNYSSPTVYSLEDVSFNASNFRLDSNSSKSGKLLYCDNFDFITNQSQTLLTNKDFSLYTESILLNTNDSIISIKNIRLLPQSEIWETKKLKPSTYLNGEIKSVGINGIKFRREDGLNYLTARSFVIDSSEIKIFNISKPIQKETTHKKKKYSANRDSLVKSLSVYEIISPILHQVAIHHIGIGNTNVDYSYTYKDSLETFSLKDFKFNAYDFLVDSIAEVKHGFWYSQNFNFEANNILGTMATRNHTVNIGGISFNSENKSFKINKIDLHPISFTLFKDHIKGHVDSICIEGLDYNNGVSAQLLKIESPGLEYFKKNRSNTKHKQAININDLLSPLLNYLSIKKIFLNNGRFVYNDVSKLKPINYELDSLNFFATNFRIDEKTGQNKPLFFSFDHFGFSFNNFINYLSNDDYKLSIENGSFSTIKKELKLQDLKFISHEHDLDKQLNNNVDFSAAFLHVSGFENSIFQIGDVIKVDSIYIDSPHLTISSKNNNQKAKNNKRMTERTQQDIFNQFIVKNLSLKNSSLKVENSIEKEDLTGNLETISLENLSFDLLNKKINFDQLHANEVKTQSNQKEIKTDLEITKIALNNFNWDLQSNKNILSMTAFHLIDPNVKIDLTTKPYKEQKPTIRKPKEIYQSLHNYFNRLSIDSFNLVNSNLNIDYVNKTGRASTQKLNSVSLGLDGLEINSEIESFNVDDIRLKTTDLNIPIDNAFYNFHIGNIDLNKNKLELSELSFASPHSKMEFAYKHPRNDDWFDVTVDKIICTDIDIPFYLKNQLLKAKHVLIQDASLQNFKNRQIDVPLRLIPMIYEGIQTAPLKMNIEQVEVKNFDATYEELAIKGTSLGKLFFTEMNGIFHGFTNVETSPNQFIRLDANGKLMGNGYFTATWMLPVDTLNDRFLLSLKLNDFDLTHLNHIVTPIAPASIRSGYVNNMTLAMDASSTGGDINMLFLYKDLKVDILHNNKEHGHSPNKLYSNLANLVLLNNNPTYPNRKNAKHREANVSVVRDPYHSTFNYLWQIVRPAVIESVGLSKKKQSFAKRIASTFQKIKNKTKSKKTKETN